MPPAARIPLSLWEREKEHIRALYLDQDKTLDELVKCMAEDHGFYATRAQYIRRLDRWKMRKYSNKEEWEYVDSLVRKRKLEGKESEIIMDGKTVSVKKLKKELGRYGQPRSSEEPCLIPPNDALKSIVACTPPATASVSFDIKLIKCTTVPWFLFHDSFVPKVTSALKYMTESDVRQSVLAKQVSRLASSIVGDEFSASIVAEKAKKLMPQKPGLDAGALQVPFPAAQPFAQIVCWAMYQISNNLLEDDQIDNFLQWIIHHGNMQFLRQLTHMNDPVTRVLKANLLLSAIRLHSRDTVQFLLENRTNPNVIHPIRPQTALQLAVNDKLCNAEIVRLLLEYGACPNTICQGRIHPDSEDDPPPLCLAMIGLPQKSSIAEMLILAGADVNISYPDRKPYWACTTPLIKAASQEDASLTRLLLEKGANPNIFYPGPRSALHTAVQNNRASSIKALLEAGADANIPYGENNQLDFNYDFDCFSWESPYDALDSLLTPIDIAYKNENGQAINLLLKARAHVNGCLAFVANWDRNVSRIALREAAERGQRHLVETLLMAGADVNAPPCYYSKQTALQAAARSGNIDMVQLLIDRGAFVNAPPHSDDGLTALQAAVLSRNPDLIELLVRQGGDINAQAATYDGQTCLTAAVSTGNIDLVDMLLNMGADIDPTSSNPGCRETSALAWSISQNDHQLFNLLMSRGAKPDPPQDCPTPLCAAVRVGSFDMAFHLIEAGASVNRPSQDGNVMFDTCSLQTPLQAAIWQKNNQLVNLLIHCHADINYSPNGMQLSAALGAAIVCKNREAVQLLLSQGANPGSAMSLASVISNTYSPVDLEIFRMLINHNAEVNPQPEEMEGFKGPIPRGHKLLTPLQAALEEGYEELASMLLEAGADFNAPAFWLWGRTALQAAAGSGSFSFVEDFVSQGADVNAPPARKGGATALQFAAIEGHYNIAVFLLENGADVNAPKAAVDGRTALEGAAENGRLDIVHLLLENDQEEESLSQRCQDAAVFAEKYGHFVIAKILRGWKKP